MPCWYRTMHEDRQAALPAGSSAYLTASLMNAETQILRLPGRVELGPPALLPAAATSSRGSRDHIRDLELLSPVAKASFSSPARIDGRGWSYSSSQCKSSLEHTISCTALPSCRASRNRATPEQMPHKEEHRLEIVELHPTFAAEVRGVNLSHSVPADVFGEILAAITKVSVMIPT